MTEWTSLLAGLVPVGAALVTVSVLLTLDWISDRRSVSGQLDRDATRARRRCRDGLHDWVTPWEKQARIPVYLTSETTETLPIRYETTWLTSCRQCGVPRAEKVIE